MSPLGELVVSNNPMLMNSSSSSTISEEGDFLLMIYIISPLLFCCFAIVLCAFNSIWKTRKKLQALNKTSQPSPSEFTEFTIDRTTKMDSFVELSSIQGSSKEQIMSELLVKFNVGGRNFAILKTTFPSDTIFYKWFISRSKEIPFILDKDGSYFVDRDPDSFGVILNYFRLRKAQQLWEACLPKDPDRLALLTQEADFFYLAQLRDQAISLLKASTDRSDMSYVNEMMAKSTSCPQGFDKANLGLGINNE